MSISVMAWAWKRKIKTGPKMVLLALADRADDEGVCWPGLNTLAEKCSMSKPTLISHVNSLVRMGLVNKVASYDQNGRQRSNQYQLNFNSGGVKNLNPGVKYLQGARVKNLSGGRVKNLNPIHHIDTSDDTSSICEIADATSPLLADDKSLLATECSQPKVSVEASVRDIFEYWQEVMGHPKALLDAKRKRLIQNAFKLGYSPEDLKLAIDGCRQSDWHMGANERCKRFNEVSLIFRGAEHIEKFISLASSCDACAVASANVVPVSGAIL